jgi:cytochrome c oxidase assembly protein subunit 15
LFTLCAIIVQGVMGALRVNAVSTLLAMIHGIWGQLCLCLACATALTASRSWIDGRASISVPAAATLRRACLAMSGAVIIQLVLGALLRHFGGEAALIAHVLWAMMVSMFVGWVSLWVIGQHSLRHPIGALGVSLGGLVAVQLLFGGVAWLVTLPAARMPGFLVWAVPTAHTMVGALILVGSVLLTLCVYRMIRLDAAPEPLGSSVAVTS